MGTIWDAGAVKGGVSEVGVDIAARSIVVTVDTVLAALSDVIGAVVSWRAADVETDVDITAVGIQLDDCQTAVETSLDEDGAIVITADWGEDGEGKVLPSIVVVRSTSDDEDDDEGDEDDDGAGGNWNCVDEVPPLIVVREALKSM